MSRISTAVGVRCIKIVNGARCTGMTSCRRVSHFCDNSMTLRRRVCRQCGAAMVTEEKVIGGVPKPIKAPKPDSIRPKRKHTKRTKRRS